MSSDDIPQRGGEPGGEANHKSNDNESEVEVHHTSSDNNNNTAATQKSILHDESSATKRAISELSTNALQDTTPHGELRLQGDGIRRKQKVPQHRLLGNFNNEAVVNDSTANDILSSIPNNIQLGWSSLTNEQRNCLTSIPVNLLKGWISLSRDQRNELIDIESTRQNDMEPSQHNNTPRTDNTNSLLQDINGAGSTITPPHIQRDINSANQGEQRVSGLYTQRSYDIGELVATDDELLEIASAVRYKQRLQETVLEKISDKVASTVDSMHVTDRSTIMERGLNSIYKDIDINNLLKAELINPSSVSDLYVVIDPIIPLPDDFCDLSPDEALSTLESIMDDHLTNMDNETLDVDFIMERVDDYVSQKIHSNSPERMGLLWLVAVESQLEIYIDHEQLFVVLNEDVKRWGKIHSAIQTVCASEHMILESTTVQTQSMKDEFHLFCRQKDDNRFEMDDLNEFRSFFIVSFLKFIANQDDGSCSLDMKKLTIPVANAIEDLVSFGSQISALARSKFIMYLFKNESPVIKLEYSLLFNESPLGFELNSVYNLDHDGTTHEDDYCQVIFSGTHNPGDYWTSYYLRLYGGTELEDIPRNASLPWTHIINEGDYVQCINENELGLIRDMNDWDRAAAVWDEALGQLPSNPVDVDFVRFIKYMNINEATTRYSMNVESESNEVVIDVNGERGRQHQVQGEESDDTGPNFEVGGGADEDELGQEMSDGEPNHGAANASGNVEVVAALEEDTNNAESMATKQYIVGAKIQAKQDNRGPWKQAVIIEVLGNNKILIFYFPMKQNTPREVKDISSIQLGWPPPAQDGGRRSRRLASQPTEEEEEARLVPFYKHPQRSKVCQRNTPIQAEHDMDISNMRLYSDLHTETESEVFNIATILHHGFIANHPNPNGNGDETEQSFLEASEGYANQTTWQVNSVIQGRMYGDTFEDKFTLRGFPYKADNIGTRTICGRCCSFYGANRKFGSCGARFIYSIQEETFTVTNASHSPECRMRRFLNSNDYTLHQKRVVTQVFVQRWETLCDINAESGIVEVWHHLTYKKTFFSHDQMFAIQEAERNGDADEVMRLVKLGNDTEGGLQLSQENFYMGSSMGRILQVKDGKIKILGGINQDQYATNKLVCIDQGTGEPKIVNFRQSDLLAKIMKEKSGVEIDMLKQMEDHSNFKRRDNRIRNREGVEAHVNAGRQKSNTTLTPVNGSGWMKLTEAQRQGRGHDVTCRACGEEAEFEEEDTLVGCSTCIFSFHRSHLFPSVEGNGPVPNGWRCVLCIMKDSSESAQVRRAAGRTWRQIERGEIRDML